MRVTLQVLKLNYSYNLVHESQSFAVNLLSEDQIEMVRRFGVVSGRQVDKLADSPCSVGVTGSPFLDEAVAYLDCRVVNSMDAGDRTVFLADVVDGRRLREGKLLTYDYFITAAPQELMDEYRANMAPMRPAIAELARTVDRGA